ncbi:MAG: DUF4019 domain-containing protein [Candidatus Binataceae bacterium]
MRKALLALALIGLVCGVITTAGYAADDAAAAKATSTAESWLKLVDSGDYAGSWQTASTLFQQNVSADAWTQKVAAVREPLGPVLSRKLVGTHIATSLPGAPDGQYVVTRYDSSFKNKESAQEVVTSMLDSSGEWRVAGYFIE